MTKNNDSGKSTTLVAIDIALRRNEVLIQRPGSSSDFHLPCSESEIACADDRLWPQPSAITT